MKSEITGITRANEGIQGISWNILGQTYVPKQVCEASLSWHATFPPGTFVPPHIHPTQDEFIYMLEGRLDVPLHRVGGVCAIDAAGPHSLRCALERLGAFRHGFPFGMAASSPSRCNCAYIRYLRPPWRQYFCRSVLLRRA